MKTLKKPDDKQKEARQAYDEVVAGVKAKIFSLFSASFLMKKSVEEIQQRLDSTEYKNNIALVTHQILQANNHARKMLKQASSELDKAVDDLSNALFSQTVEEPQISFKTRQVYDLIRRQFFGLKKEYENTLAKKFSLQRQIISPQRALAMAKNIFVRGDFKRLREEIRRYKKDEQTLARRVLDYDRKEKEFQNRDWSLFPRSSFIQQQYYLTKQRALLGAEKTHLEQLNFFLQKRKTELETLCQQHESVRKIELIATGILRKNFKFVRQLEEVETRAKELNSRLNHTKEQMKALEERIARDKLNTRYRVTVSDTLTNTKAASLIADAILFEPQAVLLVARSNGNNLEMEKDWELMSELDKDEFTRKKILREL